MLQISFSQDCFGCSIKNAFGILITLKSMYTFSIISVNEHELSFCLCLQFLSSVLYGFHCTDLSRG